LPVAVAVVIIMEQGRGLFVNKDVSVADPVITITASSWQQQGKGGNEGNPFMVCSYLTKK
jgi:hypothetical protein